MSKSSGSEDAAYSPSYLAYNEASTSSLSRNRKLSKKNCNERYDGQSPTSTSNSQRRSNSKNAVAKTKNSVAKGGYTEAPNIDYLFESDTDKKLDTQKESDFQQDDAPMKRFYDQCKVSQGMEMMGTPHLPGTLLSSKMGLVLNKAQKTAFVLKYQTGGGRTKIDDSSIEENNPRLKSKSLPDRKLGDEHILAYSNLKSSPITSQASKNNTGKREFTPPKKNRSGWKSTEEVSETGLAKALRLNSELLQKNKLLKRSSNDSKEEEKEKPLPKTKRIDKEEVFQLKSLLAARNDHEESRAATISYPSENDDDYSLNTGVRVRKLAKRTMNMDDDGCGSKFLSSLQVQSGSQLRRGSSISSWTQTTQSEMVSVGTQTHEMSDVSTQTDPIVYRSVFVQTDETECMSAATQTILVCDTQSQTTAHHARSESGCQTTTLAVADGNAQTIRNLCPGGTQTPQKLYREFNTQTSSIIGTEEINVAMRAMTTTTEPSVRSVVQQSPRISSSQFLSSGDRRYPSYSQVTHALRNDAAENNNNSGSSIDYFLSSITADSELPLENWAPSFARERSPKNVNGRGVSSRGGGTTENLDDLTANVLEARRHNQLNDYSPTMIERVLSMLHNE